MPALRRWPATIAWFLSLVLCLAGCVPVTRPVVKIGLVAPFEGRYRDVGYEVIYAVRLAVREANAAGGVAGHSVELAALDDSGDPGSAADQARKLGTDPQIVAAIGDWLDATTLNAAPIYAAVGMPLLATAATALPPSAFRLWPTAADMRVAAAGGQLCPLPCDSLDDLSWLAQARVNDGAAIYGPPLWGQPQFATLAGAAANGVRFVAPAPYPADSNEPGFAARYRSISSGLEPRANAVLAYDATRLLLDAIARSAGAGTFPTRAGVSAALAQSNFQGLSGAIRFDTEHNWTEAKGWIYEWVGGTVRRP